MWQTNSVMSHVVPRQLEPCLEHSKLTWKEHIKQVLLKSNASLAFLRRNLGACSRNIKEHCYKTSVRPIIEYATNIWAPHTTQDISKIEMLQRRAARFVCNIDTKETPVSLTYCASLAGHPLKQEDLI